MDINLPLPLEPTPPPEADEKRLWIGNLDTRVTEYHLIKLLTHLGQIVKFDFLFHKSGPLKGQPRGYCFVTFKTRNEAEACLEKLDGKSLLTKTIAVKWAHSVSLQGECVGRKVAGPRPAAKVQPSLTSINNQIAAIEAKLKSMDEGHDQDLEECITSAQKSPIYHYNRRKNHYNPSNDYKFNKRRRFYRKTS